VESGGGARTTATGEDSAATTARVLVGGIGGEREKNSIGETAARAHVCVWCARA